MTDSEKLLGEVAKAIGFKGDPDPEALKKAIDAIVAQAAAAVALEEALSGKSDKAEDAAEAAAPDAPPDAPPPDAAMASEAPPAEDEKKKEEDKALSADDKAKCSDDKALAVKLSDDASKEDDKEVKASDSAPIAAAAPAEGDAGATAGKQILDALKTATGLDEAGCVALVQDNLEAISKLAGAQPESGAVSDAPAAEGQAADLSASSVAASVEATKAAAADGRITTLNQRIAQLEAYKLSVETGARTKAAEDAVEKVILSGKATDNERESLRKLALADMRAFEKWTESKPVVVPVGEDSKPPAPTTQVATTNLTDEQTRAYRVNLRAGIDAERALELATNPEAGKALRLALTKRQGA